MPIAVLEYKIVLLKKVLALMLALQAMTTPVQVPKLGGAVIQSTPRYFAELDANNVVKRVIVADQDFINSGAVGDPKNWVETFMDGGTKKNYAYKGATYDKTLNAFVGPKPFNSWVLDTGTAQWKAPVAKPLDERAKWDERVQDWEIRSI